MLQQYLHQYQCTEEHCSLVGSMWLVLQMESSAQCGMQLGGERGGLALMFVPICPAGLTAIEEQ